MNQAQIQKWQAHYKVAPAQAEKVKQLKGLVSAFNANIDAVVKLSGKQIKQLIKELNINEADLLTEEVPGIISTPRDALHGLIRCFSKGIAEEWIINNKETFDLLRDKLGCDKKQMGGQGGIIANLAAVFGIPEVYVHCASLPKEQADLFPDLPNLKSFDTKGHIKQARKINRKKDEPLIHYIIEFDKGDSLVIDNKTVSCPKSNRFIATYDPLNLQLHIDPAFDEAMRSGKHQYDFLLLSGFHLLQETLPDGKAGLDRIDEAAEIVKAWQRHQPDHIMHFESASTQDRAIRKKMIDVFGNLADTIGMNERELIDLMEVIDKKQLAETCDTEPNAVNLFAALSEAFAYMNTGRIQLHMFGLYITIQRKDFPLTPEQNRNGMTLAAVTAASKAIQGNLDSEDMLLFAKDEKVSEIGLKELNNLAGYIGAFFGENEIAETGIYRHPQFDLIAVPTIIVDKPKTLVGMGDTISSVSLFGGIA